MTSEERHIRVPRTARYRVMGDPASAEDVWFVLHGYRQLAEPFIRRFEALPGVESGRVAVVAPEALSRFYVEETGGEHGPDSRVGATWMTRADREHEIRDYVEYLDRLAAAVLGGEGGEAGPLGPEAPNAGAIEGGSRRVVALGFSQGCATASRWVTYGRIYPAELILWGGGLAADLAMERAAEALRHVRVRLVVGDGDRWAAGRAAESTRRLEAAGLTAERVEYRGGHRIASEVLAGWS